MELLNMNDFKDTLIYLKISVQSYAEFPHIDTLHYLASQIKLISPPTSSEHLQVLRSHQACSKRHKLAVADTTF